ncbi:MAG: formylglycine-generating enzyme family protein [Bacteroidetes bacterium]|nr:formylglycine-generating enzyme family protein [Bacteroidota bacterium]
MPTQKFTLQIKLLLQNSLLVVEKYKCRRFVIIVPICFLLFFIESCIKEENTEHKSEKTQFLNVPDSLYLIKANVKMVYIKGGNYKPFFGSNTATVNVKPFLIDERPVTNKEFLEFVKINPQWRKSKIKKIFTDNTYLRDWPSDLELPKNAKPDAPICFVSWYAANTFAKCAGKRLVTLDEWEFVAMADADTFNARNKPSYSNKIVDLYLQKERQYNSVKQTAPNYWGVYNMFDLIWEWTDDFNSVLTTGDSRTGKYDDKNLFCAGSATSATDVMNYAAFMRFGMRSSIKANYTISNLGFRCAKDTL